MERALVEQHQRYQRQCDKIEVLQAGQHFHELQHQLESLHHRSAKMLSAGRSRAPLKGSGNGSARAASGLTANGGSIAPANGESTGANHGGIGEDEVGQVMARSMTYLGDSAELNVRALGPSGPLRSPSPGCAPTPPYASKGASLKPAGLPSSLRTSASPAPHTIFYTTGRGAPSRDLSTLSAQASHDRRRAHTSWSHSHLSADPTVPSLSLPEEMTEDPLGVGYTKCSAPGNARACRSTWDGAAEHKEQDGDADQGGFPVPLRLDTTSSSVRKARQSSIPPRARHSGHSLAPRCHMLA